MSSKPDDPNTYLASILARLGEDAACKLLNGVTEHKVELYGHAYDSSGVAVWAENIPPHRLRDCKPYGKSALRFNSEANSIEANASAAFSAFAPLARYGWKGVYAATHQIDALVESLRANEPIGRAQKGETAPLAPRRRGRTKGSGSYANADAALFPKITELLRADEYTSATKAVETLLPNIRGEGVPESRVKRVVARYRSYTAGEC